MAKQFESLNSKLYDFILEQQIFFTGSAAASSKVNISPREIASLRIVDDNTVVYLDRTGSGNETAAHIRADGRLTIMFCSFDKSPQILRLYGAGETIAWNTPEFSRLISQHYENIVPLGARKIVRLKFDLVQTSCGFGVPLFDFQGERNTLEKWAENKGSEGIESYWEEKNLLSIDGLPAGVTQNEEWEK